LADPEDAPLAETTSEIIDIEPVMLDQLLMRRRWLMEQPRALDMERLSWMRRSKSRRFVEAGTVTPAYLRTQGRPPAAVRNRAYPFD
jgi:hypothetical protein